jgi:uncharacterized protein YjbK
MSREVETKLELTGEAFQKLLSACRLLKQVEQLNVYYDFEDRLADHAATLRVRYQRCSTPRMTLKIPIESTGGRRTAVEIEEEATRSIPARCMSVSRDLAPSFTEVLLDFGISKVERLGAMRNRRITARLPRGSEIELDRVELPDGSLFFEVEVENDDPAAHDRAMAEISDLITYSFSEVSKFQRFLWATGRARASCRQSTMRFAKEDRLLSKRSEA